MNIVMMTNTYAPLMGGLERSVKSFTEAYRAKGHRAVIVAPSFKGVPRREPGIIRVPAMQNFRGTDFSVRLPIPGLLTKTLKPFHPDLVHAHHPFLMGDTALRTATRLRIPLIFTHHTLFEQYTHYLPIRSSAAERFMHALATTYANLCDHVFVPSESVETLLRRRGVVAPIDVVPTGVDVEQFAHGDRRRGRTRWGIPEEAFVVGHLGRLAREKNLEFLTSAMASFLRRNPAARFLVIGGGPSEPEMRSLFDGAGLGGRVVFTGPLTGPDQADAYRAMDLFAFASVSETQGLVLIEAMAAGVPVVALDAPGVREVVRDGVNGRLLAEAHGPAFVRGLEWVMRLSPARRRSLQAASRLTASSFSMTKCADRALQLYEAVRRRVTWSRPRNDSRWKRTARLLALEWKLMRKTAKATKALVNV